MPEKIILKNHQSPGDLLMLTATVRDLHLSHPGKYITDVRTPFPALWENSPYIKNLSDNDPDVKTIEMNYPIIHESNEGAYHFIHGFTRYLEDQLEIKIKVHKFWGDIYFSRAERSWVSMIQEHYTKEDTPFWLICTGGKTDYSAKWWIPEYAQEVVDYFEGKIQFVQFGLDGKGHSHPPLNNVINLIGKTDLRMFMRLMYHADGVVCPITFAMHLAAATPAKDGSSARKPCVVTAGGREPSNFTSYTNHQFLHANGAISCCDNGGCWKSRTDTINDGDKHKNGELCENPVMFNNRKVQKCMHDCVKPIDVIRAIEKYYSGKLRYLDDPAAKQTPKQTPKSPYLPKQAKRVPIFNENLEVIGYV
jgi:hypothetical protein